MPWHNRTNKEIRAMMSRAASWTQFNDTHYGAETYEMGVHEALRWVLGELTLNPIPKLPHEQEA
jgi:hypothetical protein